MELQFSDTFLLLGLIQGMVVSVVTLRQKSAHQPTNQLFALLTIGLTLGTFGAFRLYFLNDLLYSTIEKLIWGYFPYFLLMILGPTLYFYSKSLIDKESKFTRKTAYHFLPVILELLPFLIGLIIALLLWMEIVTIQSGLTTVSWLNRYEAFLEFPRLCSISYYLVISWRQLQRNKAEIPQNTYFWLYRLLLIFSVLVCVYLVIIFLSLSPWSYLLFEEHPYLLAYLVYYPIIGLIYYLSIKFMLQQIPWRVAAQAVSEMESKAEQLHQLMEQKKLYLDADFKLRQFSEQAEIPEKTISFILNHHYKKGFNDFVNEYRIHAAITKINQNYLDRMTLEGLAYEVGFSSRSTFYRAFKKVVGQSPSEYLKD